MNDVEIPTPIEQIQRERDEALKEIEKRNIEIRWIRVVIAEGQHVCIGVYYGKQESYDNDKTQDEFDALQDQILAYQMNGDEVILLGDFNAKVGQDGVGIQGGDPTTSRNGKMLKNLIENTQTIMLNSQPICKGKWTRVNSKNPEERSILDYVIVSPTAIPAITSMTIDEEEIHKFRSPGTKSDHNTIYIDINMKLAKTETKSTHEKWKVNQLTNWHQFNSTLAASPVINTPPTDRDNMTEYYEKWIKHVHEIATEAIGKYPTSKGHKRLYSKDPEINQALSRKKECKRKYLESLHNEDKDKRSLTNLVEASKNLTEKVRAKDAAAASEKLRLIATTGGVNSRTFWGLRKKLVKGSLDDLFAVKSEDGERIFNPETIKEYTANYYENLYTPSEAEDFCPEWTSWIEKLNHIRLETKGYDNLPYNQPLQKSETDYAKTQLHSNRGVGPDNIPNEFIQNSETLQNSCHDLFKSIFQTEDVPKQWGEGKMLNFKKGKGDPEFLSNKRGITLTSNVGKLFERVLNNRVMGILPFSGAQAGGQHGKGPPDQLFTLYEILKQRKAEKKPTYVAFLDVHKAYDKAWRGVILHILWEANIRGKLWRLLHHLNTDITAQILTRFGLTRIINVKGGVKQGRGPVRRPVLQNG